MRHILFLLLLIPVISFSQNEIRVSIIEVDDQIYFMGDTLGAYILKIASGNLTTASNGITKLGQDFKLGGSFDENTTITGGGNDISLGTSGSRTNLFNIYASTEANINVNNGAFSITAAGNEWTIEDNYLKVQRFGDTDTIISIREVRDLINASQPFLPFNFTYDYSTLTADSRPGIGNFRLNNATYSSVTEIYIDAFDKSSTDKSKFTSIADTGTFISISDGVNYVNYKIDGYVVDLGNYIKYKVAYLNNSGNISGECTINLDMSSIGGGGEISVDTANYARGSAINENIIIEADTALGFNYIKNGKYIVQSDTNDVVITLPDVREVNKSNDVKELQFILKGEGSYTLEGFNSQTINGQSNILNNVEDKALSVIPYNDSTWYITQDSRGDLSGQLRIYPLDSLSGISTFYAQTTDLDSVGDVEQIVYSSVTTGLGNEIAAFISDSAFFDATEIEGGTGVFRLRMRIIPAPNDAANVFVSLYLRYPDGTLELINDSTNRVAIPQATTLQYVNYESTTRDYVYDPSYRFLTVIYADEIISAPVIELAFEGLSPTFYTRNIDPSIIKVKVSAAGINRSSQYSDNGVLSGDSQVLHKTDTLVIKKRLSIYDTTYVDNIKQRTEAINITTDSLGLNGNYINSFYQNFTRSSAETITASETEQTITFEDLGSSDYTLIITTFDASGNMLFPTITNKTSNSFDIQININCTLYYNVILNQ